MMLRLVVAIALVTGIAQAADSVRPLRGETTVSFQCRAAFIPEARQCAARCDATLSGDARWECVHACTTKSLWDMSLCREQGAPAAAFASR